MAAFSPLLGQERAILLLTQAVQRQRVAPAYAFVGAKGIGKRLAARCFVKYLFTQAAESAGNQSAGNQSAGNQAEATSQRIKRQLDQENHPDLLWVAPTYLHQGKRLTSQEAAAAGLKRKTPPQIRLEQIREVARFVSRPPLEAPRSVIVIEQAETMAEPAANALLKTLEEPGQATLILTVPSPDSILPTLISRCQTIPFSSLQPEVFEQVLTQLEQQSILQNPALRALAQGSPGTALSLWKILQEIPDEILQQVTPPFPTSAQQCLQLAAQVSKSLELEQQIWLLQYLQHQCWQPAHLQSRQAVEQLEEAGKQLLRYIQPLLVWEVLFLKLAGLG